MAKVDELYEYESLTLLSITRISPYMKYSFTIVTKVGHKLLTIILSCC